MHPLFHWPRRIAILLGIAALCIGVTGCPKTKRNTLVLPEPLPDVPTHGDADARARFEEARSRFERDGKSSTAEFQAIAQEFPDDPVTPYALLYAGISALKEQSYDQAIDNLRKLDGRGDADPALRVRGGLYLGFAYVYTERYSDALTFLRASESAVSSDDERAEWLGAMAEATSRSDAPLGSLPFYDRWYSVATPAEKRFIVDRVRTLSQGASAEDARAAFEALDKDKGPAAALLGTRVAADLSAAGNAEAARELRAKIRAAREAIGLTDAAPSTAGGAPGLIGAVLPLTGRRARAGDLAMRGLAVISGTFRRAQPDDVPPFSLILRDTASTTAGSQAAVESCAEEGAIAIIGPIDGDSVDAASARAHGLRIPLISLNPRSGDRRASSSPYIFHIMQSAEDRAEALARYAAGQKLSRFAILHPQNGYGKAVSSAFRSAVERQGGTITKTVSYKPEATSFTDVIGQLGRDWDAIFIPDQAKQLELITPALAAADLVVHPASELERARKREKRVRPIALLSTAEFIEPAYVRGAARYSRGAILAPGFYPDRSDRHIGAFVDRYEQAFGALPTPLDAYAYDAALMIRRAVDSGAESRAALTALMEEQTTLGLTGAIRFDKSHRRADDGLLFVVTPDGDGFAIRALRD